MTPTPPAPQQGHPSLFGRPEDMAGIAVFLASGASSYITGAVIPVGGGVLAAG